MDLCFQSETSGNRGACGSKENLSNYRGPVNCLIDCQCTKFALKSYSYLLYISTNVEKLVEAKEGSQKGEMNIYETLAVCHS